MHQVRQSLGVHEAMLNGDLRNLSRNVLKQAIDGLSRPAVVVGNLGQGWPVGGLVGGLLSRFGVDSKGEQMIERRMKRGKIQSGSTDQVPVERL